MIRLSVVVPIYNDEGHIFELYQSITDAVKGKVDGYEIVLVNDGSRDRSGQLLDELSDLDQAVRVVHFEKNCGHTAALWAGIRQSEGELIALLDGDLRTDPRDIFKLMAFIDTIDFVNGKWVHRKDTVVKKITLQLGNKVRNWLTGDNINDTGCPMKLFTREVAESLYLFDGMHRFLPTLAKMNGFSVIEVSVAHRASKQGGFQYGVLHRTFAGFMDAIIIRWLKKRVIRYRIKEV